VSYGAIFMFHHICFGLPPRSVILSFYPMRWSGTSGLVKWYTSCIIGHAKIQVRKKTSNKAPAYGRPVSSNTVALKIGLEQPRFLYISCTSYFTASPWYRSFWRTILSKKEFWLAQADEIIVICISLDWKSFVLPVSNIHNCGRCRADQKIPLHGYPAGKNLRAQDSLSSLAVTLIRRNQILRCGGKPVRPAQYHSTYYFGMTSANE